VRNSTTRSFPSFQWHYHGSNPGNTPCKASTSDVTIASLVSLSANCVHLDFLQLHFNANNITTRHTHASSRTHKFTCKLRTLSVGSQPLPSNYDDILLVTFTILRIFPHVNTISCPEGDWEKVRRGVQLYQRAPRIVRLWNVDVALPQPFVCR